jgi:hypothetical protein
MSLEDDGYWNSLSAKEYAERFPARPKSLRKIARVLKELGAGGLPFTMPEHKLAKRADISVSTWQRGARVFEEWGILEVKRWRFKYFDGSPNTYRVFLRKKIPPKYRDLTPPFRVSARERRGRK